MHGFSEAMITAGAEYGKAVARMTDDESAAPRI